MKKQRIIWFLIIVVFWGCSALPVSAKTKNITNSFNDKAKVEALVGNFYSLANLGSKSSYNFSKKNDRKKALRYIGPTCYWEQSNGDKIPASFLKQLSKRLFGCSTSGLKAAGMGDWGGAYPVLDSLKYYKKSSSKYMVKADVYWVTEYEDNYKCDLQGSITLELKKKKSSYYGYIVKSYKFKKAAKKNSWKTITTEVLAHDWYTKSSYSTDNTDRYVEGYKTTFTDDGKVSTVGYRNKDFGTYKISKNKKKVVATFNNCYFFSNGSYWPMKDYSYTVTYRLSNKYKLYAKYSNKATDTNAVTGYIYQGSDPPEFIDVHISTNNS